MGFSMRLRYPNGLAKALTLSYDDGVVEDIRLIEIMNRHGLKGTFNLNSLHYLEVNYTRRADRTYGWKLTRDEAIDVYGNSGQEVALHAHTHPFLETLPPAQVAYEIIKNREVLEEMFGTIIDGMAYPFGTFSDAVVDILKNCGVLYSRTCVSTRRFDLPVDWLRMPATCHHTYPDTMELADAFLNKEIKSRPELFYLWGHSYEFDADRNWDVIERFCDRMAGHEDIWYATNIEIYEYIDASRRLVSSCDGRLLYNPSATDVWVTKNGSLWAPGEKLCIPAGKIIDCGE